MSSPRGRILNTNRDVHAAPGVIVCGTKPRILVYVKTGSCRMRNDWMKAQRELGLDAIEVQAHGEDAKGNAFVTAYDVTGTPGALERLVAMPCVKDWHFMLDVAVRFQGTGSGDKPKRRLRPIEERLLASIQQRAQNDALIAQLELKNAIPTLERHALLGI